MAPLGPFARVIAQVIVPAVAILARALPAAYAQALQNARKSGEAANAAKTATSLLRKQMSHSEALQILNFNDESEATPEKIQENYDKYFAANAVKNGGGSFYLQSKVYRAKELLDEFQQEKRQEEQQRGQSSSSTTSSNNNSGDSSSTSSSQ